MNLKKLKYKKKYYIIQINQTILKINKKKKQIFLLDILLLNNINIFYECKNGYCGTCRIKLIKGKIQYIKKNLLAVKKKGYIFPCCCIINSNIIIQI